MSRKIEVNEDDLKKVILMLKLSKQYLQLPPQDLFLSNLWRVAPKLADKLMRKAELTLVQNKGRIILKPIGEVHAEATVIGEESVTPPKDKPIEEVKEEVAEATEVETEKVHRCRKRKPKA